MKAGKVGEIRGLEEIRTYPNVIQVLQRFQTGDSVTNDMVGTERQVFARIYTVAQTVKESAELLRLIHCTLTISNEFGDDMILDWYQKESK